MVERPPLITMNKVFSYKELIQLPTYGDRLEYLRLNDYDYSSPRDISSNFYKSRAWLQVRKEAISRDLGCDLAITGMLIEGPVFAHHMNPLTRYDLENFTTKCLDLDNIVCVSELTHNKIHYNLKSNEFVERKAGDTKLW